MRNGNWLYMRVRALVYGIGLVLLLYRSIPLLSVFFVNLGAIHIAKSGTDLAWTMQWQWDVNGLVLDASGEAAGQISSMRTEELALAYRDSLQALVLWHENVSANRAMAYWGYATKDYAALAENLSILAEKNALRPWDALALAKVYEWQGAHGLALARLKDNNTVDYLLRVAEREYYAGGDAEDARRMAAMAVEAAPNFAGAYYLLGHILVMDGRKPEEAIRVFSKGAQLQPENANMQIGLAHAMIEAGRYEDALGQLRNVLPRASNNSTAHLLLGDVYLNQGNLAEAAREYSQALNLEPKQVWAMYGLGRVYAAQGRRADAIAAWQGALQINPRFEPALNALNSIK